MRARAWLWVRAFCPIGQMLPWWMLAVRALLFPIDSLYWWYSKVSGYDFLRDEWRIYGVRYSGEMLVRLAQAQGEVVRIERRGDVVVMTNVKEVV